MLLIELFEDTVWHLDVRKRSATPCDGFCLIRAFDTECGIAWLVGKGRMGLSLLSIC